MIKKKKKKHKNVYLTLSDPNAKAMWGRTRSQTFRDKTKYTRKKKHKNKEESYAYFAYHLDLE